MKLKIILGYLFFLCQFSYGCICPELDYLDLEQCSRYDFIAYGLVVEKEACPKGMVTFVPSEVFKGKFLSELPIEINCEVDCLLDINKGEYWLIYGKYTNAQEVKINFCGHSRKQLPDTIIDYQSELSGRVFQKELQFLQSTFELQTADSKHELKQRKYEKVDPALVPWLFGIGGVVMVIGYLTFFRTKKKNTPT